MYEFFLIHIGFLFQKPLESYKALNIENGKPLSAEYILQNSRLQIYKKKKKYVALQYTQFSQVE